MGAGIRKEALLTGSRNDYATVSDNIRITLSGEKKHVKSKAIRSHRGFDGHFYHGDLMARKSTIFLVILMMSANAAQASLFDDVMSKILPQTMSDR